MRWVLAIVVMGLSAVLFGFRLEQPADINFDEFHYVKNARWLLERSTFDNPEHPMVGKIGMALGMHIWGDNPIGWRIGSVVMGVVTVGSLYWLGLGLFRSTAVAVLTAVFAMLSQTLFVQARIGMLDVYLAGFFFAGLAAFVHAADPARRLTTLWLVFAGVMFGLAFASKWSAIPYAVFAGVVFVGAKLAAMWRERDPLIAVAPPAPGLWPHVSLVFGGLAFTLPALAVYFATFWPTTTFETNAVRFGDIFYEHQLYMLERQTKPLKSHPYESEWWAWPLMFEPMWYFHREIDGVQRGVFYIGNPMIYWGGLVAVLYCLIEGLRRRVGPLFAVGALYVLTYGIWAVLPKQIGFLFYYLIPSLTLCLALSAMLVDLYGRMRPSAWRVAIPMAVLGVSLGLFVYFYPLISAMPLADSTSYQTWMWFNSWR